MSGYYHTNILPWTVIPDEARRFRRAVQTAVAIYVVIALAVSLITVPKQERSVVREVPPQLAKLILDREKPKPPPVEAPKKEEVKKEEKPKPKEEKKPEKKPEPKKPEPVKEEAPPAPPKVDIEAARKKAAKTGLLALSDDLADLRDNSTPDLSKNIAVTKTPTAKATPASAPQVLSLNSTRGSGGVDTSALARAGRRSLGSGGELQGRATESVESPVEAQAKVERKSSAASGRVLPRTLEEIQLIFDKYKGVIQNMYQRALRTDPSLKGKVVLEMTIAPDGSVTKCNVVSSELDAKDLLSKLVARVKAFNFGAKDVGEMTITYPIDFAPIS